MSIIETASPPPKRHRKMAREPQPKGAPQIEPADGVPAKRQGKVEQVLHMLQRSEGANIEQLVAMTGWLPHTTRAALTGLKKKGHDPSRPADLRHADRLGRAGTAVRLRCLSGQSASKVR